MSDAQNVSATKLIAVYGQLKDAVGDVPPTLLFEAAERLVRAEEEAKRYQETWQQSPYAQAALGTATGIESWRTPLPTMDAATAAREVTSDIEAAQFKTEGS